MKQYLDLLQHILDHGTVKSDRTGTGTKSVFGYQMRFDLSEGFPLLTTKKLHLRSIIYELLWFINCICARSSTSCCGSSRATPISSTCTTTRSRYGTNGPMRTGISGRSTGISGGPGPLPTDGPSTSFHRCWTRSNAVRIRGGTSSRPGIPPRSIRWPCLPATLSSSSTCGVPFNIASYALLTMMVAQECGYVPGDFVHTFGDVHIYLNHFDQVREQLSRTPRELPRMVLNPEVRSVFDFDYDDFRLEGYDPWPAIKAPVSV